MSDYYVYDIGRTAGKIEKTINNLVHHCKLDYDSFSLYITDKNTGKTFVINGDSEIQIDSFALKRIIEKGE